MIRQKAHGEERDKVVSHPGAAPKFLWPSIFLVLQLVSIVVVLLRCMISKQQYWWKQYLHLNIVSDDFKIAICQRMMIVKHRSFPKHCLHLMMFLLLIMTGDDCADGCNACGKPEVEGGAGQQYWTIFHPLTFQFEDAPPRLHPTMWLIWGRWSEIAHAIGHNGWL